MKTDANLCISTSYYSIIFPVHTLKWNKSRLFVYVYIKKTTKCTPYICCIYIPDMMDHSFTFFSKPQCVNKLAKCLMTETKA